MIAMHVDQSARDAQEGYRYTAITAGDHKNDFSPHQPLDREATGRLQAEVDRLYGIFVDHVAAMRTSSRDVVRSTEAGLYFGADAVTAGLADARRQLRTGLTDFSVRFSRARRRESPQAGQALVRCRALSTGDSMKLETPEVPVAPEAPTRRRRNRCRSLVDRRPMTLST